MEVEARLDDVRSALHESVGEHPGVGARVSLLAFDDDGQPVGEFRILNQLA